MVAVEVEVGVVVMALVENDVVIEEAVVENEDEDDGEGEDEDEVDATLVDSDSPAI